MSSINHEKTQFYYSLSNYFENYPTNLLNFLLILFFAGLTFILRKFPSTNYLYQVILFKFSFIQFNSNSKNIHHPNTVAHL